MKVRFAYSPATSGADPGALAAAVDAVEQSGFDSLWFSDLTVLGGTDPLLAVAYAASRTRRLKLGVNLVPFGYQPFVFARQVAQLDRLSGGRLLVTLVPGLDLPGERAGLGTRGLHRGRQLDALLPQLRRWWDGSVPEGSVPEGSVPDDSPAVPTQADMPALVDLPAQQPLEVWLGGSGPEAVARAGRLADGWLGALMAPERAGRLRRSIEEAAAAAGRAIDPEHFGLSVTYARDQRDLDLHGDRLRRLRRRTGTADAAELVPVGSDSLRSLVARLVDEGLSKFVVRPLAPPADLGQELAWLSGAVLDLQT